MLTMFGRRPLWRSWVILLTERQNDNDRSHYSASLGGVITERRLAAIVNLSDTTCSVLDTLKLVPRYHIVAAPLSGTRRRNTNCDTATSAAASCCSSSVYALHLPFGWSRIDIMSTMSMLWAERNSFHVPLVNAHLVSVCVGRHTSTGCVRPLAVCYGTKRHVSAVVLYDANRCVLRSKALTLSSLILMTFMGPNY